MIRGNGNPYKPTSIVDLVRLEHCSYDLHKMGRICSAMGSIAPKFHWKIITFDQLVQVCSSLFPTRGVSGCFWDDRLMHQKQMQILKRPEMELGRR